MNKKVLSEIATVARYYTDYKALANAKEKCQCLPLENSIDLNKMKADAAERYCNAVTEMAEEYFDSDYKLASSIVTTYVQTIESGADLWAFVILIESID